MSREEELVSMYGYIKGIIIGKYHINHPDYEDVMGDVFVCCVRNMSKFKGDSTLKTWVYRITVRRSSDYLRKVTSHRRGMEKLRRVFENSRLLEMI